MADDLLESLVRPDNLVEWHLGKELKFLETHRQHLEEVEQAVSSSVAPLHDTASDPVILSVQPAERIDVGDLIGDCGDEAFRKVMTVLAALCDEINFLRTTAERKFYAPLALFGFTAEDDQDSLTDGLLEAMAGRAMSFFQDAANFIGRVNSVLANAVKQLQALFDRRNRFTHGFSESRLKPFMLAMGDLLTILATFDAIIEGNSLITAAWEKYKRLADVMRADPAKYGADPSQGAAFNSLLTELDSGLMSGRTLRTALDQYFEDTPEASANTAYREFIRDRCLENIDALLSAVGSEGEMEEGRQVVGQYCLYALYRALDRGRAQPEAVKTQFLRLWKVSERLPLVVLYGVRALWTPDGFLTDHCPVAGLAKREPRDPRVVRGQASEALFDRVPGLANVLQARVAAWTVRAEASYADNPLVGSQDPSDVLRARGALLTQALALAASGQRAMTLTIAYALLLDKGFRRSLVEPLGRIACLLKALDMSFRRYNGAIAETAVHLHRAAAAEVLAVLSPLRLRVASSKKGDASLRFLAACTDMVTSLLVGTESFSPVRRAVLDLGLSLCVHKAGAAKESEVATLARASWLIGTIADYANLSRRFTDTTNVFYVRDLLPAQVQQACNLRGAAQQEADPRQGLGLHHLFAAASDAGRSLASVVHLPLPPAPLERLIDQASPAADGGQDQAGGPATPQEEQDGGLRTVVHPLTAYERFLRDVVMSEVVTPLSRAVEADLRLVAHAVHLAHMTPPSARTGKPPLVYLLQLPPIRILGFVVDIKSEVTRYLERTFYELTTVALHDWKTYGEMSSVARDKYGLHLASNHLPMGQLDAGLDVLQIMRNIHVFVGRYVYNMNQQFFIEKKPTKGAKHLNVVSVRSIGASIRQHGSGCVNTAVNFAYQFLAQKFYVFSQFLADEYIKSYLSKERRAYKRERKALDNRYPVDRAMAFTKDIRSLGVGPDKSSFLDKFRILITEIGGALGYVRMVRAAAMASAADAAQFVPDLADVIRFAEAAARVPSEAGNEGKGLSAETNEACVQLDAVLAHVTSSFGSGSDYLHLLVSVFQHVLGQYSGTGSGTNGQGQADGNGGKPEAESHLRNFFLIVPSLTISFVESLRASKDRLEKSVKGAETAFCDDGFPLGLAYILAILKQNAMFDSLHWWDAVFRHHRAEIARFKAELAALGAGPAGKDGAQGQGKATGTAASARADGDRVEELQFKIKRAVSLQAEYDSLYYAFSSARSFFRQDSGDEEEVALKL